jgi:hypothetical protein
MSQDSSLLKQLAQGIYLTYKEVIIPYWIGFPNEDFKIDDGSFPAIP